MKMNRTGHQPIAQSDGTSPDFDCSPSEPEQVSASLIGPDHTRTGRNNDYSTYLESDFDNVADNPYKDTTESDINIRHIPLADLVPRPWKTFEQVMLGAYISVVLFFITGLFAVRFARRGKRHQSKGLMGMAQKDLRLAVWLIYASAVCGFLLFLVIIPIAASA